MALYSQCFSWIILKINQKIKGKENFKSIGILDIFGFENFEVTSDLSSVLHILDFEVMSFLLRSLSCQLLLILLLNKINSFLTTD